MNAYFGPLAERLQAAGIPEDRVAVTIDDLRAHLEQTGTDPETEFGPVPEFAAQLLPVGNDDDGPLGSPDGELWRWRADAFEELRWLETFGDQGWEVERVDRTGRFVCRRDGQDPQQWEYRRELVGRKTLEADATALEGELAPDGWEPCGVWVCYAYFKRSKAALIGPAATIDLPQRRPNRKSFYSRRFYLFLIGLLIVVAVAITSAIAVVMVVGDSYVGGNFASGALIGAAVGVLGVIVLALLLFKRAQARADRE
ncbi:hypothetical protein [Amycolatopsis taiwanensis]|uniref:DUF2812 domain-containing protein n=1 Tax=Amycolatopsis taiwanensis TaxID=342230 RepID=A0A9W6R4Q8_9PSEU|nr:hypothetical protein [Amycolatopsis taiwanensis]GLY67450.1 hypothetical protein Atai01_40690 [Amycolatopsis taiwanensis]